jgi:hypothetical protein
MTTAVRELGETIGALELLASRLSRAEHGDARKDVAAARSSTRREVARLEVLRAQLAEQLMIPIIAERLH